MNQRWPRPTLQVSVGVCALAVILYWFAALSSNLLLLLALHLSTQPQASYVTPPPQPQPHKTAEELPTEVEHTGSSTAAPEGSAAEATDAWPAAEFEATLLAGATAGDEEPAAGAAAAAAPAATPAAVDTAPAAAASVATTTVAAAKAALAAAAAAQDANDTSPDVVASPDKTLRVSSISSALMWWAGCGAQQLFSMATRRRLTKECSSIHHQP